MENFNKQCRICHTDSTELRNINLYPNGSEGLDICLSCELKLVDYIRQLQNIANTAYLNAKKTSK